MERFPSNLARQEFISGFNQMRWKAVKPEQIVQAFFE
jgi:hypothetical protein